MTILITGSTGKTSFRLAQLLQAARIPYIIATRRSSIEGHPSTKLDWLDESTFSTALASALISSVYLVAPDTMEPAPYMNKFIDLAVSKGIKKFVLCAGTSAKKGGMFVGTVWSHLEEIGVEFVALRPSWFMENFSEMQHVKTIKEESAFYSAAEEGKMPFISANDIAEAGFAFLSGKKAFDNKDHVILGPELLTHDDIARIFSDVLGRPIKHIRKSQEDMVEHYTKVGVKPLYANFLPFLEAMARDGNETKFENDLENVIGQKGITFKDWVVREAKKGYWG